MTGHFKQHTLTVAHQMVNELLCWVNLFVNVTDNISASPAVSLTAQHWWGDDPKLSGGSL